MKYGTAILALILLIVALNYFSKGYEESQPSICSLSPGLACLDHSYEKGKFMFIMGNNLGETILVEKIEAEGCDINRPWVFLKNGESTKFTLNCENFNGNLDITYKNTKTGLTHKVNGGTSSRGEYKNKDIVSNTTTSKEECNHANNNGLCGFLNINKNQSDYKERCCSEWNLCCGS